MPSWAGGGVGRGVGVVVGDGYDGHFERFFLGGEVGFTDELYGLFG